MYFVLDHQLNNLFINIHIYLYFRLQFRNFNMSQKKRRQNYQEDQPNQQQNSANNIIRFFMIFKKCLFCCLTDGLLLIFKY